MKNFEMRYPVEGATALQPKAIAAPAQRARIIAFPAQATSSSAQGAQACPTYGAFASLRFGSVQGAPFGRMQRWQAVVGGCVLAAAALGSLFIGL